MSGGFDALYASTGNPSIPPEMLLGALLLQAFYGVRSDASTFSSAVPEGYDTRVGDRGALLSCGQRQCETIARAMCWTRRASFWMSR